MIARIVRMLTRDPEAVKKEEGTDAAGSFCMLAEPPIQKWSLDARSPRAIRLHRSEEEGKELYPVDKG